MRGFFKAISTGFETYARLHINRLQIDAEIIANGGTIDRWCCSRRRSRDDNGMGFVPLLPLLFL